MLRFLNQRGCRYDPATHPEKVTLKAEGCVTFGRRRDNDVCLDSLKPQLISRVHASITGERQAGGEDDDAASTTPNSTYTLASIGMNGVTLNGTRVKAPTALRAGDKLVFGCDESISELVYEFYIPDIEKKVMSDDVRLADAESNFAADMNNAVGVPDLEKSESESLLARAGTVSTPNTPAPDPGPSTQGETTAGMSSVRGSSSDQAPAAHEPTPSSEPQATDTATSKPNMECENLMAPKAAADAEQSSLSPLHIPRPPPLKRPHEVLVHDCLDKT